MFIQSRRAFIIFLLFASLCIPLQVFPNSETRDTLSVVKQRGYLICGVSQGLAGFSTPDDRGQWQGIDVDFCKAVAAAVFGDAQKVNFIPLSSKERFTALQSGEVDLLSRNTSWTFSRDTTLGLEFVGILYYDGQGFMVRENLNVSTAKDLSGTIICTNAGTTTELNLADFFQKNNMKYQIVTFEKSDETVLAYEAGRCDVYSTDQSGLFAQRLQLKDKNAHIILPEVISKEPLGPLIRQGDDDWGNIVRWTLFALINAEELGITKKNILQMKESLNPDVQRLLGTYEDFGRNIGLNRDWAFNIISQVGNYGEIFNKNLGSDSLLKIDRGINQLWCKGGILYAPPFR